MRKGLKLLIISFSALFAGGLAIGTGVTLAASYKAPAESTVYTFGSMTSSNYNFQSLSYYFAGGTGASDDPFLVKNSQHLRNLAKLQNSGAMPNGQYFSLACSFQFEGDAMEPIGTATYPFTGVFNGNDHLITKLAVSTSTCTDVGMFGRIGSTSATGTAQNFILAGPSISYTGSSNVNIGIIAGYKTSVTGQVSVVQNVEVFGGTASFDKVRAHLYIAGGSPTVGNKLVGVNGSTNCGFVASLSSTPSYTSTATYGSSISAGTHYYLYHNGSGVVKAS